MSKNLTYFRVLQLYKRIIKISYSWQAINHPSKTLEEQIYIRNQARELFRKNKNVKDSNEIEEHIREGEARIELACHYRNPYPRLVNLPTYSLPPNRNRIRFKSEYETEDMSRPIYLKSFETKEETLDNDEQFKSN
ncbi:unnamed protein product [Rotaria magnacalcarata]|uniref:Complex 1 LYR protein domain-containing protein n=1 Tax=Rotaria magnacalcarata TaxID=392030 RepID=A0A815JGX2_9BILA|nr:unnamed protein product [Rotaria magnacalcarata]CAF1379248.1 unnamed protein product [Rotaria magnacalcarata]CAF2125951.1 unnamed protein product [Rotaria magnacalcarata]CAF3759858.1 unnamed protein product [Rotaria magnacalcarata]CAF3809449.1 unnamed protein product [Rotaria magnacalcarata]